jgi:putative phosphoesterase
MKVLVLSDIHDHISNLAKVVHSVEGQVESAVFCGDLCSPFSSKNLSELAIPVYCCLGNNDEDQIGLLKQGGENLHWTNLSEEFGTVELGGRKIAYCHYPRLAELLAKEGNYDAVFYGHTHFVHNEIISNSLLLNPGSVCGIQKGRTGQASYAIYDTEKNSAAIIKFE